MGAKIRISGSEFIRVCNESKSMSDVARHFRISRETVRYRIKKMREKGSKIKEFAPQYLKLDQRLPGGYSDKSALPDFEPDPVPNPTLWAPGSVEKVEVLAERVEQGEMLWHADDATPETAINRVPTSWHKSDVVRTNR